MSRSYKKHVIVKDGGKATRQMHNRRERSRNKQRVKQGLEPLDSKEITNPYYIVDWSWQVEKDDKNYTKFKRK